VRQTQTEDSSCKYFVKVSVRGEADPQAPPPSLDPPLNPIAGDAAMNQILRVIDTSAQSSFIAVMLLMVN